MRPVASEFEVSQGFGSMATAGVVGNINAARDTVEYYVGLYGNYQPFGHAGEDIACPVGTPVHAMADGTVLWADWGTNLPGDDSEWGYRQRWYLYKGFPGIVTVIQHPGWIGVYAHLSSNDAAPAGTTVREGQLIGYSGNTGGVAPHLHREALVDLNYTTSGDMIYGRVNPARYDGAAAIAPQSTTPQESYTMAQFDDLRAWASTTHAKLNNIAAAVNDIAAKNRLFHGQTHAKVNAVKSVVDQIAKGQNVVIDWAKVEEAAKTGAAEALAEGIVTVDVNVNGKDAA